MSREDMDAVAKGNASQAQMRRVIRQQRIAIRELTEQVRQFRQAALARGQRSAVAWGAPYVPLEIRDDQPQVWQQRTFRRHAAFGFVSFSAYRISPTMIVVPGIGSLGLRGKRRITRCTWISASGRRTDGTLGFAQWEEHHGYLYEPLVLNCTLPPSEGSRQHGGDGAGGNPSLLRSSEGGHLEVQLDQEVFYPYREDHGYEVHADDSRGPFQHELVFCGPPMFGNVTPAAVVQWIHFHRFHAAISHFFLYDSGAVSSELRLALQPMVEEGLVTITDFREGLQYDVWAQNQALAMNDCLYRSREIARWVAFHDLDEYLEVPSPATLPSLLRRHADKAWLSHGCLWFEVDNCDGVPDVFDQQLGRFAVEVLRHGWTQPYCFPPEGVPQPEPDLCPDFWGHRKLIVNPRKVKYTLIHVTGQPQDGGMDLPAAVVRHAHFRNILQPGSPCRGKPREGHGLVRTRGIADIAAGARKCAANGFVDETKCRPGLEA